MRAECPNSNVTKDSPHRANEKIHVTLYRTCSYLITLFTVDHHCTVKLKFLQNVNVIVVFQTHKLDKLHENSSAMRKFS